MTDKPAPPLNLIERMAQRLEKENASMSAPPVANVVGRSMERDALDSDAKAYAAQAQAPALRRDGVAMVGPGDDSVRMPAAAPVSKPAPSQLRPSNAPALPGKTVRLDFRALRQNGCITPDNMTSSISNEFRGIKRKLLQRVRDPQTRAAVSNLIMVTSSLPGEGRSIQSRGF